MAADRQLGWGGLANTNGIRDFTGRGFTATVVQSGGGLGWYYAHRVLFLLLTTPWAIERAGRWIT